MEDRFDKAKYLGLVKGIYGGKEAIQFVVDVVEEYFGKYVSKKNKKQKLIEMENGSEKNENIDNNQHPSTQ